MFKKALILCLALIFIPFAAANAQSEPSYSLRMMRNFGYGGMNGVQGNMTISLKGDESKVQSVEFLIDGQRMALVESAPFKLQFNTDQFPAGAHKLSAVVMLQDGNEVLPRELSTNFLSSEEAAQNFKTTLLPILGIVLAMTAFSFLIQSFMVKKGGKSAGAPANYGLGGGAVCPGCGYPFPRSLLAPHIGSAKICRCPNCKRWSWVGRASAEALRAAETIHFKADAAAPEEKPDPQKTRQDILEDSRYVDEI